MICFVLTEVIESFLDEHEVPYSTMVKCPMPTARALHEDSSPIDE